MLSGSNVAMTSRRQAHATPNSHSAYAPPGTSQSQFAKCSPSGKPNSEGADTLAKMRPRPPPDLRSLKADCRRAQGSTQRGRDAVIGRQYVTMVVGFTDQRPYCSYKITTPIRPLNGLGRSSGSYQTLIETSAHITHLIVFRSAPRFTPHLAGPLPRASLHF